MKDLEVILKRFKEKGLIKGYKTFLSSNINYDLVEEFLIKIVNEYIIKNRIGEVLSLIYLTGKTFNQDVNALLYKLYQNEDFPSFLKHTYRFGRYVEFKEEIEYSINWHIKNNTIDAFAWRIKFTNLANTLEISNTVDTIKKLDEDNSINKNELLFLELSPINRKTNNNGNNSCDIYISTIYEKKKLEISNKNHKNTQNILEQYLKSFGINYFETKHIDTYAEIGKNNVIFEVKSITETNEITQMRLAISQLYEYSFLYAIKSPLYVIVFSSPPQNEWIIRYLEEERNIRVLWVNDKNQLDGPSYDFITKICNQQS